MLLNAGSCVRSQWFLTCLRKPTHEQPATVRFIQQQVQYTDTDSYRPCIAYADMQPLISFYTAIYIIKNNDISREIVWSQVIHVSVMYI